MPEGHTVHRLAGAFRQGFVGHHLAASSPQGRFTESAALLDGLRLHSAEAWGKQMFLRFDKTVWLRVHLGLYGMWRFAGPGLAGFGRRTVGPVVEPPEDGPAPPRGQVRLRLVTGRHVADLSGPTACEVLSPAEKDVATARLGPDPLRDDADPERAWTIIHASRSALGLLLMRQDVLAGIGNIYRAELLFRGGLDPHRPGRDLSRAAWEQLWQDAGTLLADGVRTGRIITTRPADRPHRRGKVTNDESKYVAHRTGLPCRVCATPIRSEVMAGRKLYFCPVCQTA